MEEAGLRIHITGIVQGVGFRPFVYGLATRLAIKGWVRNTSAGVEIEVDGDLPALDEFIRALRTEVPPLAQIDELEIEQTCANGYVNFAIIESEAIQDAFQPVSPDVCVCPDCLRELFDPKDRRYRYPFINCTNCGPRFTIIQDIPYDRPNTTMSGFPMCPDCSSEYQDPLDRRFHAQPVACPVCGPRVWLEYSPQYSSPESKLTETIEGDQAIRSAQSLLVEGKILAIKGLGGFHLACDALNLQAVSELRRRKLRVDKPFALMMPDIYTVSAHCALNEQERLLLESHQRPVVILQRREGTNIADQVSPNQDTLGVMLPYTPLHYLLFAAEQDKAERNLTLQRRKYPAVLVMTSGNISEEPIAIDNDEARQRLAPLADAFLMHDRPIRTRCDDSVVRVFPLPSPESTEPRIAPTFKSHILDPKLLLPIRRSRGYAPFPLRLKWNTPPLLAVGAELKNTFCLARDRYAFISHHIGDMENYETLQTFEDGIAHLESLFRISPSVLAYDLHPNYLATRYALERAARSGLESLGVQHHHAHVAACMAEHGLDRNAQVIGVAFDGTGYGADGAIWGGEFLLANYSGFTRAAHLDYIPLPGGDAATRKPARTALAYLWKAGIDWETHLPPVIFLSADERNALHSQLELRINSPLTSSMGRLFDAAAALAGIRQQVNFEAQAAIEFENLVDLTEMHSYPFDILGRPGSSEIPEFRPMIIDHAPLIKAMTEDIQNRVSVGIVAARFHNAVAAIVVEICQRLREMTTINEIVLSGGVWQNVTLLTKTYLLLQQEGFVIYHHNRIPPNDGGISLGQAAVAANVFSY